MSTGLNKIDDKLYRSVMSVMEPGWEQFDSKWYYYTSSGDQVKKAGLNTIMTGTISKLKDGEMVTGNKEIDGQQYSLKTVVLRLLVGNKQRTNENYYASSGELEKGWIMLVIILLKRRNENEPRLAVPSCHGRRRRTG